MFDPTCGLDHEEGACPLTREPSPPGAWPSSAMPPHTFNAAEVMQRTLADWKHSERYRLAEAFIVASIQYHDFPIRAAFGSFIDDAFLLADEVLKRHWPKQITKEHAL